MTPEALRTLLEERLGEKEGEAAWFVLLEALEGRRFYWPKAVRRDLLARTAYEASGRGEHPLSIARRLGVTKRTVERWIQWERRRKRHRLAKTEDSGTHAFRRGETTP